MMIGCTSRSTGLVTDAKRTRCRNGPGSCWYYLRYIDPKNDQALVDPEKEKAWMPVDLYVGGAEHAVLHLLYSRFWHKVLYDRGHVSTAEPFGRLVNQGMILGEVEFTRLRRRRRANRFRPTRSNVMSMAIASRSAADPSTATVLGEDEVEKKGEGLCSKSDPTIRVESRAHKMSKSRGNVVNPDEVVREYGADSLASVRNVHGTAGSDQAVGDDRVSAVSATSWTASGE